MRKIKELEKSEWAGNKWPSITVRTEGNDDYDPELFKKVFEFIKETYSSDIDKDAGTGTLADVHGDRCIADFKIADCSVMMDMDDFMFSIAFSKKETRDEVFDKMNDSNSKLISK